MTTTVPAQRSPPLRGQTVVVIGAARGSASGSVQRLELVVSDIKAARDDLIGRGVEVSRLFHRGHTGFQPGPDPERRSYLTCASFSDPDGNGWLLQEVRQRAPGRTWGD